MIDVFNTTFARICLTIFLFWHYLLINQKMFTGGISLVVQWLRLCVPKAEGPGLIPGQGLDPIGYNWKILHAAIKAQHSQITR